MQGELLPLLSIGLSLAIPASIFFGRSIVVAYINEKTRANFENQIESVRSDLRQTEESFRAELQAKERNFNTLVDNAFADQSGRRSIIATRKIEAIESIWKKFGILGQIKGSALFYQNFKIEAVEQEAQTNAKFRNLLEGMAKYDLSEIANSSRLEFERLFIPDIV